MHFKAVLILCVLAFVNLSTSAKIDLKPKSNSLSIFKHLIRANCDVTGYSCISCLKSKYCFEFPNGDWLEDIIDCENGETCSPSTGRCSKDPNPECDKDRPYAFECHQFGLFPHPFDCAKYFLCNVDANGNINIKPQELKCKSGFWFDPLTTLCRQEQTGDCVPLAPECTAIGKMGPIGNNRHMYYVCLRVNVNGESLIKPQIFNCEDGKHFGGSECVDPTPKTGLDSNGRCNEIGSFHRRAECGAYNDCEKVGDSPIVKYCPVGEFFERLHTRKCVRYSCLDMIVS